MLRKFQEEYFKLEHEVRGKPYATANDEVFKTPTRELLHLGLCNKPWFY